MRISRAQLAAAVGTLVVLGGGVAAFTLLRNRVSRAGGDVPTPIAAPKAVETTPRWLDGTPLPEGAPQPSAVAVVVDNAPESQPQAGLAAAPLVFEVPVEGRRTRFLAVYPTTGTSVVRIGPVRSARPYFVGLADALAVPLVHVGGSPAALALLASRPHVNQYFDPPFTRDHGRSAPFNVFTALSELASFVETRGLAGTPSRSSPSRLWSFAAALPQGLTAREGQDIRLAFSGYESSYVVAWKYDSEIGVYIRRRGGAILRDADGTAVAAANVVVLSVQSRVLDAVGRLSIPAIEPPLPSASGGSGSVARATVFRGGQRIDGQWGWEGDPSDGGVFGLRQAQGAEGGGAALQAIPLAPGTTWVEVVDWNVES